MVDYAALRSAIDALEETSGKGGNTVADMSLLLGRLYATYAQTVLEKHGVGVDLMALCGDTWDAPRGRHIARAAP
ncbi:MAG TPA: hypothetical protein VD978_24430 [Azospirillum sp.]|nr:hypothetical protein [Azospirillum sp.]